jgi:hypothetical protein
MLTPLLLLGAELTLIAIVALVARRDPTRVRHRRVRCPLDGKRASQYLFTRVDGPPRLIRCSLLDEGLRRDCNRECLG